MQHLSPKELATAIGVSESSLKRWANEGRINVNRTVGGHRRINLADAVNFIRNEGMTVVRPDLLGLTGTEAAPARETAETEADHEALLAALKSGDSAAARQIVLGWYIANRGLADIYDGPIRWAMHEIGKLWVHREEGIFLEHRATDLCVQAISQIRGLIPAAPDRAPVAIGGAPSSDPFLLPSLMASTIFAELGYHTENLGPDLPLNQFVQAAEHYNARVVWLSMTGVGDRGTVGRQVAQLDEQLAERDTTLVVGGQRCRELLLQIPPHTHFASNMSELAAFASGVMASHKRRR